MEKQYMYLVYYSIGEYADYREKQVFVTLDENKAIDWVLKFDKLLAKVLDRFKHLKDIFGFEAIELENWEHRYFDVFEINGAFYTKIEIR